MTNNNNILTPSEGYTLTNGEIYSKKVYLGIYDSPNNWYEIPDAEVPEEQQEQFSDAELAQAARILLGVEE